MQSVLTIVRKLLTERCLHLQRRKVFVGDLYPNSSNTVRCTSGSSTSTIENFKDTIYAVSSGQLSFILQLVFFLAAEGLYRLLGLEIDTIFFINGSQSNGIVF